MNVVEFTRLDRVIAHEGDKNRGTRYRARKLYTLDDRQYCQKEAVRVESYNDVVERVVEFGTDSRACLSADSPVWCVVVVEHSVESVDSRCIASYVTGRFSSQYLFLKSRSPQSYSSSSFARTPWRIVLRDRCTIGIFGIHFASTAANL